MKSGDPCPRCGEEVQLIDPADDIYPLDPADYEEDARVWLCWGFNCNWSEEATDEEIMDELDANITWLMGKLNSQG